MREQRSWRRIALDSAAMAGETTIRRARRFHRLQLPALALAAWALAPAGPPLGSARALPRGPSSLARSPQDPPAKPSPATLSKEDQELEALVASERSSADRMRRRGEVRQALRSLDRLLDDEPADSRTRALRARCRLDQGELESALEDARRAFADAKDPPDPTGNAARVFCARELAEIQLLQGEAVAALETLKGVQASLSPASEARDAWVLGRAYLGAGQREAGLAALEQGAKSPLDVGDAGDAAWESLLAKARCERRLGFLERASRTLVAADTAAQAEGGAEPDVLAELGEVYFEADGEVEHPQSRGRSPAVLFNQARQLHPTHEAALLGLFALHRFNWNRQSRPPHEILGELLAAKPRSIAGLLAGAAADLDDGQLVAARERIATLEKLCPKRRELRTLQAALAWIEHAREACEQRLAELAAEDPLDGRPERELGRTLCELYRFAEGVPFLKRSVERDPLDHEAWTQLGRALANTGQEQEALEALHKAETLAAGRQNAWRHNTTMVLERMGTAYTTLNRGELSFVWSPAAAEVLQTYLVPFYRSAREELSTRYGYTPGPVQIEVFQRHRDFSVRSTGFEGFPALGVCFGPVVTAVSPISELRGSFSWARTSFHEFTHVIHLGLSHNRCPRWITEGLATWEEEHKNPAWTRNMRRELIDARANGDLIPVRELNRAFRGPRILFGYYQGGLLCKMLIDAHGFPPMIRLLEAFDRGRDLDQALREVFERTPEQLDREFEAFVDAQTRELRIEPRWSPTVVAHLALQLPSEPPREPAARERWVRDVCSVAWGHWQSGNPVDAEQALRRLANARLDAEPPRASFLRGEMALSRNDSEVARAHWEKGLALGGDDYRVHMALGKLCVSDGDLERAERHFLDAEDAFPGYDDPEFSAELALAELYQKDERTDEAQDARQRWLRYDSGDYQRRMQVAAWHTEHERPAEAARLYQEANEIDPFRRKLHTAWAEALSSLGRHAEALREFGVALVVPPELDADHPKPLAEEERAQLLGRLAECLLELGRAEEAAARVKEALALDPECAAALAAKKRLP
jgi:tetratricopeptide (TPR) repeat protein